MKRHFIYLAIITVMAMIILLVFSPDAEGPQNSSIDTLLLPEIADRINDVNRVEVLSAGATPVATLVKAPGGWQLEDMGGYRADWSKLQSLLAALATARVVEKKTDNPLYYVRLGVEDIQQQDAGSVLVRLGVDDHTTGVLIGNSAQGRPGQYVRLQDVESSVLIDQEIDVPTSTLDWAESRIIDINASEVAEVEVIHPDSERILIMRISADQTDFDLVGLPTGREIKSSWAVNSLASVLSMLEMQSVRPDEGVDWSGATKMRLLMFSGVEVIADVMQAGDEYLLRLSADHPDSNVVKNASPDPEQSEAQQDVETQAAGDLAKMLESINAKTAGWIYVISSQKYDAMVKKPEDLLKPVNAT